MSVMRLRTIPGMSTYPLVVTSLTPDNGVIFSDGVESDYLEFGSGVRAQIGIAERVGNLVAE